MSIKGKSEIEQITEAIFAVYESLPSRERESMDALAEYVIQRMRGRGLRKGQFGMKSAIELIGKLGISLCQQEIQLP